VRAAWVRFEQQVLGASQSLRDPDDRYDAALLLFETERRLYDLDSLRVRERDPRWGPQKVLTGIRGLLQRTGSTPEARAVALEGRLGEVPAFLGSVSGTEIVVSSLVAEQALALTDALTRTLLEDVPAATAVQGDTLLTARLGELEATALEAVWEYREWLTDRVLPRAEPGFALGAEGLRSLLRGEEWIDVPLDTLRTWAEGELDRLGRAFLATAARIDSTRSPRAVLARVQAEHPAPDAVVPAMTVDVAEARDFVERDGTTPLPSSTRVEVYPLPRSARWTNASLLAPGPFEPGDPPSDLFVAVPDPLAPPDEQAELSRFLNDSLLLNLAVHEAYPGHALQAACQRRLSRPARRAITSTVFVEGWAHYAEDLVLERGFRSGDLAFRLATLQSQLRRAGRFRAVLGLHTENWTMEDAAELFETRCFLAPSLARKEASRSAGDPLAVSYTLGRMELEAVRSAREREEGEAFDLRRFHEDVLDLGAPPPLLLRSRLLGGEVPIGKLLD